jgi:neutral ceramidase
MIGRFTVCLFVLLLAAVQARPGDALSVGYGEADITPEVGGSMPGYFTDRISTGVLDPLLAKVLVLSKGPTRLAIVALDLIGLQAPEVDQIRAAIYGVTRIPVEHVFVHSTHTHTGAQTPRRFTTDAERIHPGLFPGKVDPRWTEGLPARVAAAAQRALAASRETDARLAVGRQEGLSFYRRFVMKDGTIRTNPGRANPDVVRPAGDVPKSVYVVEFPRAKTLLVSFALHPDCVGGTRYSADYPYHLTEALRESLGQDHRVLYLNSACGNINHIDVGNPDQLKGYEESRRIGRALAATVLASRQSARDVEVDALAARSRVVRAPLRPVPDAVAESARRDIESGVDFAKRNFNELHAPGAYILSRTQDRFHPSEVMAFRIGPLALVGLPAEVFVEIGREIQTGSPFNPTVVIGLTGGAMGYMPHRAGFAQGGYEAGYRSARYDPSTPDLWIRTAVELLRGLGRN